jgi:hypothetical protein
MFRPVVSTILATTLLLSLSAHPHAASDFSATIKGKILRDQGCHDGAMRCGEAAIAGFGSAQFRFDVIGFDVASNACLDYDAIVTFTLDDDGSTLTLRETGLVCGPGNSFFNTPQASSWGNPDEAHGTWEVLDGTGVFEGVSGTGTDALKSSGASVRGSYTGTLIEPR